MVHPFIIRILCVLTGSILGAWRGHLFVINSFPDPSINEGVAIFYLTIVIASSGLGAYLGNYLFKQFLAKS